MPDFFPIGAHSGGGHIPVPTLKFHNDQTIKHGTSRFFCFLYITHLETGVPGLWFQPSPSFHLIPGIHHNFMKGKSESANNQTLPKAQRTRGLSSAYESNLMDHITSSNTNIDPISSSESRPSTNFKMSTKHEYLHKT